MKPFFLCTIVMCSSLLSGCHEDSGLLALPSPSKNVPSLSAAPQIIELNVNDTHTIDLTASVNASGISSWTLDNVTDTKGLGQIINQSAQAFDYHALNAGITSLPYTITGDNQLASSEILIAINEKASAPNTAPTAQNITKITTNQQDITIDLHQSISDVDGDTLNIDHFITPSTRFIDNKNGTITYKPNGFIGVDSAAYGVSDNKGGHAMAYIVITSTDSNPTPPNTAPTANDIQRSINVSVTPTWRIDLLATQSVSDVDGDTLRIVQVFADNNRVTFNGTQLTYTPNGFIGVDQFTYVISDDKGGYAVGTVTLTLSQDVATNTQPLAAAFDVSNIMDNETQPLVIDVTQHVSDVDGDPLHLVSVMGANGRTELISGSPLAFEYTPPLVAQGLKDTLTYVISDSNGGYAMSSITINMSAHNPNAPQARIAEKTTNSTQSLSINLDDYISDKETSNAQLIISKVALKTPNTNRQVSLSGKTITYVPNGFVGVDVVTYTVSDGELSTQGMIVITATSNITHTLSAQDITQTVDLATNATTPVVIPWKNAVSSDATDGKTFTLVSAQGATLGTLDTTQGVLSYTPKTGKFGVDQFVYTIKDGHSPAHYAQGIVTMTLTPPPLPNITQLSVDGKPSTGAALTANVVCDTCSSYQYRWLSNGLLVGAAKTYIYQATDSHFNLRLEVSGEDAYQQKTDAYVVYNITKMTTTDAISSTGNAFAAIKPDGSVITWGDTMSGGDSSSVANQLLSGVKHVYSNRGAFAVLKEDGSVVTWGSPSIGGDSNLVANQLISDVKYVYAASSGMIAIKTGNKAVVWGSPSMTFLGSDVRPELSSGGIDAIYSTSRHQAILKNGVAFSWGADNPSASHVNNGVKIKTIITGGTAFAFIREDGSAGAWGASNGSGSGGNVGSAKDKLTSGVVAITATTQGAFAALKDDGSVVTWGDYDYGANSSAVANQLRSGVKKIFSTDGAFAALKEDGSVVTWGDDFFDAGDSSLVAQALSSDVIDIFSAKYAFAALKKDGSVVTWGLGGGGDSSAVANQLRSGVRTIFPADMAFAALKEDGSVVSWGEVTKGGDSSSVANQLNSGVSTIFTSKTDRRVDLSDSPHNTFIAQKEDGSFVIWGAEKTAGDNIKQAEKLAPIFSLVDTSL